MADSITNFLPESIDIKDERISATNGRTGVDLPYKKSETGLPNNSRTLNYFIRLCNSYLIQYSPITKVRNGQIA